MIPDDKLFGAHPKDLGTFDVELLDMKVGNLTVRQFIKLSKLIKAGRNPVLKRHTDLTSKIIIKLQANPSGVSPWMIAKEMKVDYSVVRYYLKKLIDENKVKVEELMTKEKRKLTIYKMV
jgi:ribosomal protein S25